MTTTREPRSVLLTGATGYVGSQLLPHLEQRHLQVRCLARRPQEVCCSAGSTHVIQGDLFDIVSLRTALEGVDTAYYLVHSMGSDDDFETSDRQAAWNFARAARHSGVRRIIYLGGLGDDREELSPHLRSRHEVGAILRESGCEVIEFRSSIVIGSGSLSFEIVRALVERLPVMICPRWVATLTQPIAIEDVLDYLLSALDGECPQRSIVEIGGPDRVTYGDIMVEYGRQCGLRRTLLSVPVLTPRLSSLWLSLVTPAYARVGRALVESMRNPTIIKDDSASQYFPVRPRGFASAIESAIAVGQRGKSHRSYSIEEKSDETIDRNRIIGVVRRSLSFVTSRGRRRWYRRGRGFSVSPSNHP